VQGLAEHEPMAVGGAERELAHAPGLVSRWMCDLGAGGHRAAMKGVHVVDAKVCDVAVIAQLRCRRNVWAATKHERDGARPAKAPVAGGDVVELAAQDVPVPRSRDLQVVNGQYRICADDPHDLILRHLRAGVQPIEGNERLS
jgi:hypothetical protein